MVNYSAMHRSAIGDFVCGPLGEKSREPLQGVDASSSISRITVSGKLSDTIEGTASGKWAVAGGQSPAPVSIPTVGTGMFKVSGGKIADPYGNPYRAKGVNVCYTRPWGSDGGVDITRITRAVLQRAFPGINFIRFANWAGALSNPADPTVAAWISDMTSNGIVVETELHYTGQAISGTDATACNWLAAWASQYRANPRVWLGTQNEPHGRGISKMQQGQYAAIRATGNASPVMLCCGDPGAEITGLTTSVYAAMTNVAWDMHYYGWMPSSGHTWPSICTVLGAYSSKDGAIPVLCLETGDATDGKVRDANWRQVLTQSLGNANGFAAWQMNWNSGDADNLMASPFDGSALTDYGQTVRTAIETG